MRIGLLAPPWVPVPPPNYGGTEAVIDRLARGFRSAGHDVLLWTIGESTCPVPSGFCYESEQSDRIGTTTVELRQVINGYRRLSEWGADIIHDHTMVGPVYGSGFAKVPVVTTNHGPFNQEALDIYGAVTPSVAVIAISEDQRSHAGKVPVAAVIHHGIDVDDIEAGEGRGDSNGPYLMFLGRMTPEKGVVAAIEVAHRTGRRLLIAAKMRERDEKRFFVEAVEPLLDERTCFLGEIGNDEKLELLGDATALVNPICWPEPFGLVMIEALAVGTPVVSLPAGSAPEIIRDRHNGLMCADLDEMVARMDEVDSIDRGLCRLDAEQRFSTGRMVENHLKLFRTILDARNT